MSEIKDVDERTVITFILRIKVSRMRESSK